ncbi:MAG: winged helix-turn-helix domain-containing protein [Azonexaceae bacterium]|uniref:winged helix-turn-helix domain-containing protein n=1 Tax=Azonexus sp. R2A61 TaxID=2744443 RepID=UPI001F3C89F6|nr:winged helix-turn-helix domain-containing protein [Azonexus sp. R2A61]MCE1240653.1 winged helix-turn-helix domain-containing protein [Azonexaceae bacterium]
MSVPDNILLVEDDWQIREFISIALEGEGYAIHEAATASHGAVLAASIRPCLLILDLGLPDRDGQEFIADFRAWSSAPILVLSARSSEYDKVKALDAGADDYLSKPFGVPELLARVRAMLRRRHQEVLEVDPLITFGDFRIDCVKRLVTCGNEPLHLTQIEYKLLIFLAANPGRVFTHRQLLRQVWGGHAVENHQYLRVYVGHLRQKIEENPARPRHILTENGVGYRFQP